MHIHWGRQLCLDWQQAVAPDNRVEIDALSADRGRHRGYVRAVAHRRADRDPGEPMVSVPVRYTAHPVLRDSTES